MSNCYHCDLPVPENTDYVVKIGDQFERMCCIGCKAVAQMIIDNGLQSFYQFRSHASASVQDLVPESLRELTRYDDSYDVQNTEIELLVKGINCAACAWLIEQHLLKQKLVTRVSVNVTTHIARVVLTDDAKPSDIIYELQSIGFNAFPFEPDELLKHRRLQRLTALKRLGLSGIGFMQVMMYAISLYIGAFQGIDDEHLFLLRIVSLFITTPIVVYCGAPFFLGAKRGVIQGQVTIDLAISIAILFSYFAGVIATVTNRGEIYFDSVSMLIFLLTLTRYLEMMARHHGNSHLTKLHSNIPQFATRIVNNEESTVPLREIKVGDVILVKAGDTVSSDGVVVSGTTHVSEMLLTGEFTLLPKGMGDKVLAGSQNSENPITVKIQSVGCETVLSKIIYLLQSSQIEKPKILQLTDRIASCFVTLILCCAVVAGVVWWVIDPPQAFWVMISVLVISCPCALSIAAPLSMAISTNRLAEKGFLIVRGHVLSALSNVSDIVFDKTGTLTTAVPIVRDVVTYDKHSADEAMMIACSIENYSEHPIAGAFKAYSEEKQLALLMATNIYVATNSGLQAEINGEIYFLGKKNYIEDKADLCITKDYYHIFLAKHKQLIAGFNIEDSLRADAAVLCNKLRKLSYNLHLLTGDGSRQGLAVVEPLKFDSIKNDASPNDKLEFISQLQQQRANVAMIGDGINDIPTLSAADVSISLGSSCDLAKMHADVILLNDELELIPTAFKIAHNTIKVIKQNIIWALLYNAMAVPVACAGYIAPYIAVIGMSCSSLIVVGNALRIRSK